MVAAPAEDAVHRQAERRVLLMRVVIVRIT